MNYLYEELIGFMYNNTVCYYLKDVEKRIVGIISETGAILAKYKYTGYGVIISRNEIASIANVSHFLYKSYYYDDESNMYYIKDRYYSLDLLMYISPADVKDLDLSDRYGFNLYQYAKNNPIINCDYNLEREEIIPHYKTAFIMLSALELFAGVVTGEHSLITTGFGSIVNSLIDEAHGGDFESSWGMNQLIGLYSIVDPCTPALFSALSKNVIPDIINGKKINVKNLVYDVFFLAPLLTFSLTGCHIEDDIKEFLFIKLPNKIIKGILNLFIRRRKK